MLDIETEESDFKNQAHAGHGACASQLRTEFDTRGEMGRVFVSHMYAVFAESGAGATSEDAAFRATVG